MSGGGRSQYDKVRADQLDINDKILLTFDPDAVPDAPAHNPGVHADTRPGDPFIAGKRTGALLGEIQIFHHDVDAGIVDITTEHGTVRKASAGCPVWRERVLFHQPPDVGTLPGDEGSERDQQADADYQITKEMERRL